MILDLHNHTRWSFDCSMDPAKVVRVARSRGIDAIAITDHDEIDGAREAAKAANGDILVIIGEEIDTAAGDILGLWLQEKIVEHDPIEAIKAIHAQGGLAILAHPFTKTKSVDEPVARARTVVAASTLDEAKEQIRRGNTVLSGRRSSPFNLLASVALRSMKSLLHPEPE